MTYTDPMRTFKLILNMMRKRLLWFSLASLLGLATAISVYALTTYMTPTDTMNDRYTIRLSLPELQEGTPIELPLPAVSWTTNRYSIFVLLPSAEQESDLIKMSSHIWQSELPKTRPFIFLNKSTRFGGKVVHKPKGVMSSLMRYPDQSQQSDYYQWLGGFIDPVHDSSYDYAGRAIKSRVYTWNGYASEVDRLLIPKYEIDGKTLIINDQRLYP